jgi:hypothetical protein
MDPEPERKAPALTPEAGPKVGLEIRESGIVDPERIELIVVYVVSNYINTNKKTKEIPLVNKLPSSKSLNWRAEVLIVRKPQQSPLLNRAAPSRWAVGRILLDPRTLHSS